MRGAMLFHHPGPLFSRGRSGSTVRPFRMARAFEEIGYEVHYVVGDRRERHEAMCRIIGEVRKGFQLAFAYSESRTIPTALADPDHVPMAPFMDYRFFRWLRRNNVPVGLFYRDIYWRFDVYRQQVPWYKRAVTIPFYWLEWWQYTQTVDHLFLPSLQMRSVLPTHWPAGRLTALPPGCEATSPNSTRRNRENGILRGLYVGGVLPPLYDLTPLMRAVRSVKGVQLTLCCRQEEWQKARHFYDIDPQVTTVVHLQGEEVSRLYADADVFLMYRASHPYLEVTVPVKLFEAIGHGVPIVANAGTEAGRIVEETGVGWTVEASDDLERLLMLLRDRRSMLDEKRECTLRQRSRHTWAARAETVAQTLGLYRAHHTRLPVRGRLTG